MRALKALVIGMGVVILIGFVVVVVAVVQRIGGETPTTLSFGGKAGAPPAAFGDLRYDIPAGAEVTAIEIAGGRLYVTVRLKGGGTTILVIDTQSGKRLGTIELIPRGSGFGSGGAGGASGGLSPGPGGIMRQGVAPRPAPAPVAPAPASPAVTVPLAPSP